MKLRFSLFGLLLTLGSLLWGFNPDDLNTVTVTNGLSVDIYYLFAKPEDAAVWGPDILGADHALTPGESHTFNILYITEKAGFTFLAVDENDVTYEMPSLSIVDGTKAALKITPQNKSKTKFEYEFTTVNLTNKLDYDIHFLFFSPDESEHYGADILDSASTLESGGVLSFLVPVKKRDHKYNVMAVDADDDSYSFNVNLNNKSETHDYDIEAADLNDETGDEH